MDSNSVKELMKTATPSELRRAALSSENSAIKYPLHKEFYINLAEKYKRMAYSREWLWEEYCKKCKELEE